jgi:acyl-CoA dehydrogenase
MNEFVDPFERMLGAIASPAQVRAVELRGDAGAMWPAFAASGFLDALVAPERGGGGLTLAGVHPLWEALGRYAVPLPVGETMIARYLLAAAGAAAPEGPLAIATADRDGVLLVPSALVATQILVEAEGKLHLVATDRAQVEGTGVVGSLAGRLSWQGRSDDAIGTIMSGGLRAIGALLRACLISGAAGRLIEMTVAFANERVQFGKPIGRQQANQQNLAVMAEDVVAVRIASQLGCAGGLMPSLTATATAKSVASTAAARLAASAHAIHGAIGISEEHDLQLFTRRMHEWRLADGSAPYWNQKLGAARLAVSAGSVDFVRASLGGAWEAVG